MKRRVTHSQTLHWTLTPHSCLLAEEWRSTRVHWMSDSPHSRTHPYKLHRFSAIRKKHFTSPNLSDLFKNVPTRTIVDFIKEIGLYRKLWILNGVFTTSPPSVLLLYVIRIYQFLHLYYCNHLYIAESQCSIANNFGSYQRDWTLLKT